MSQKGDVRMNGVVAVKMERAVEKYSHTRLKPARAPCGRAVSQSLPFNKISAGKANGMLPPRSTHEVRSVLPRPFQDARRSKAGQPANAGICLFTEKLPPVPSRALEPELHRGVCVLVWAGSMAQGGT